MRALQMLAYFRLSPMIYFGRTQVGPLGGLRSTLISQIAVVLL